MSLYSCVEVGVSPAVRIKLPKPLKYTSMHQLLGYEAAYLMTGWHHVGGVIECYEQLSFPVDLL